PDSLSPGDNALLVDRLDLNSGHDLDAKLLKAPRHLARHRLGKSRENTLACVEQNNGTLRRIDAMEVASQRDLYQMRQRSREFHPTWTCADQHERHLSRAFVLVLSCCGQFECAQYFGSNCLGVAKALETRRISREFVVPEVARAHAGRNHQIIERDLMDAGARGGRLNRARFNVDARDLRQEYRDVSLLRLKLTNRRSDLGRREDCRGHLIEQR